MKQLLPLSYTLLLLLAVGCGGDSATGPTGSLSGTVTFEGQPVGDGVVNAFSTSASTGGTGTLSSDGSYVISNLPVGTYEVYVTPVTIITPDTPDSPGGEAFKEVDNIPNKYRSSQTSKLSVTIAKGDNTLDIAMTK